MERSGSVLGIAASLTKGIIVLNLNEKEEALRFISKVGQTMRMTHFPFLVNPISPGARQIYTDPVQTHIPRNQWMEQRQKHRGAMFF